MLNRITPGLIAVLPLFFQIHQIFAQAGSIFYGERSPDSDLSALFLDKEGWWYPAFQIDDDSLRKAGSLKNWYATHPTDFGQLAIKYGCHFTTWNEENGLVLNDSICQDKIRFWSDSGKNRLIFLVHGFRKTFHPLPHERDSPSDYQQLKKALGSAVDEPGTIVEVYWDGMYGCCFSASPARNRPLFRLFETAAIQAENAGKALGTFLARLPTKQIGLISHSLGAKVVLHALTEGNLNRTSEKDFRLCLIGPAIGPDLVLGSLKKRREYRDSSRLRIDLVYNEEDFVLRKKDPKLGLFGPGPRKYGDTRLGCNAGNAALKLAKTVKAEYPEATMVCHNLNAVGGCHHIWCYTRNGLLDKVFLSAFGKPAN